MYKMSQEMLSLYKYIYDIHSDSSITVHCTVYLQEVLSLFYVLIELVAI